MLRHKKLALLRAYHIRSGCHLIPHKNIKIYIIYFPH
ncbi:unnamed protein product [Brassica rapa subsp. trilocularis]